MKKQMWYWLIRRFLKYSAFFIAPFEILFISKYSKIKSPFQPVFIIGPPRSGSTILYQIITEYLNVLFIDNLINMARRTTWFGFWLSYKCFGSRQHHSFKSNLGHTEGLHAPNEGLFWYKWLPKTKHFVNPQDINNKAKQQMTQLVYALINKYHRPIVFKNLSFSVRLPLIKQMFPNTKIIYIKRDPLYVAQSILVAKKRSGFPVEKVWSINPKNSPELEQYAPEKQVVHQTYHLYQQIEEDLTLFDPDQVLTLWYEEINDTHKLVEELKQFMNCAFRQTQTVETISPNNRKTIDDQTFETLKEEIKLLDWTFLKNKL